MSRKIFSFLDLPDYSRIFLSYVNHPFTVRQFKVKQESGFRIRNLIYQDSFLDLKPIEKNYSNDGYLLSGTCGEFYDLLCRQFKEKNSYNFALFNIVEYFNFKERK